MEDIFTKVNNLYNTKGFLEKYGTDLWISIIICIVFFIAISYYHVFNNIQPIVADWDNQKCNPSVIPFAGLINKSPDTSAFEFTGKNFTGCIQTILKTVAADAFKPIYYIMKLFTDVFQDLAKVMVGIRAMFNKLRLDLKVFAEDVMSRILNITMPIMQFVINMKDMLAKTNGVLSATVFTLFGSYYTLKSAMGASIEFIVDILYTLAGSIAALAILAAIPIIGIPAEIAIIPMIAIFTAILIPTIMIQGAAFEVLDMSPIALPGCFAENTKISKCLSRDKCNKYSDVTISSIQIGDRLKDGSLVTGVIKFSATEQTIYNLDNVTVTGEHRVLHESLGWLKVKNHPGSIKIDDFKEPFVYCLITDSKTFKIGNTVYSDWDDIDDTVMRDIITKCRFIPQEFTKEDIHHYLDNGLHGQTLIPLDNGGKITTLEKIKVNDILLGGIKVVGIVKIDALNLRGVYRYKLATGELMSTPNIEIEDPSLGIFNTSMIHGFKIDKVDYLYQLITESGDFYITMGTKELGTKELGTNTKVKVKDYNYGIDQYIL